MVYNSTIRKQEEQKLELKWFGEYRELIEKMILYGNSYARTYKISCPRSHGFKLSPAEMQVIEYLLENEERQENMLEISQRLGISASSFRLSNPLRYPKNSGFSINSPISFGKEISFPTTLPSATTLPAVGRIKPAIARINIVLPLPLWPTIP